MTLYLVGLGLVVVAGAGAGLFPDRVRVVVVATIAGLGCVAALVAALETLAKDQTTSLHTTMVLPLVGADLTLDPLGALFIALTAFAGVAALLYLVGYAHEETRSRTALGLVAVFIASLLCVPAASSVATFMAAWEVMALSSMLLILTEHRHHPEARSAAQWYGAMTQWGAAAILLGLLILARHGQSFAAIHAYALVLSPAWRSVGFVLVLLGFASKAGAVPFHVWLPKAHPQAPGPVSALMSSAMVSTGVYGIVRVGVDLLHGGSLWWWIVVAVLGVASALFGALHSATSNDLKTLLAYSTIDILGLTMIGVGASGALAASGEPSDASLLLVGALFLLAAHAAFKGLLFLAAGAVERATGTRDLNRLGGLIARTPTTTTLFALGALSIVAVPGLAGFSGEWLILEGLLHGFADRHTLTLVVLLVGVASLALTGGLTALGFVKALGVGFLGYPRSAATATAVEAAPTMRAAMVLLAVPCLVLGLAPGIAVNYVERAASTGTSPTHPLTTGLGLALARLHGMIEPMALLGGFALIVLIVALVGARHATRAVDAWRGGGDAPNSRMQYTATSFGEPLQRVFGDVLRPEVDLAMTHAEESRYYDSAVSVENRVDDVIERVLYRSLIAAARRVGVGARRLQNGSVHRYLAWGFVALVVVVVVVA